MHFQVQRFLYPAHQLTLIVLSKVFLIRRDSVGLWINGLVALAETVQGGEMDALVSLLREKVRALNFRRLVARSTNFFIFFTHCLGIAAAFRV